MNIKKHKNKIIAVVIVVVILILAIIGINFFNKNTLKQTKESYTHEAGKELVLHATDFFDADEEQAAQITFDTSAVDVNTIGEYTVTTSFKNKTFEIKVTVADTTAPKAELSNRYIFTNNIEQTKLDTMLEKVSDASEWSAKLVRYEKHGNLEELDEKALKSLTDSIPLPASMPELEKLGTESIPTEEGIYRAVMQIIDAHGNYTLEELFVIYDTTGAYIEDTPDKTITVEKENLDKEPEIDKSDYAITDNVDGKIPSENIQCELELRDADKHEWLVHVSYTDRAGNESKADFLIIVKEKKEETPDTNTGDDTPKPDNTPDTTQPDETPDNTPPGDEVTEVEDEYHPSEQAVIDAGYGVVVQLDSGNYSVLTHGDGCVNGKDGSDILREYLAELGLEPSRVSGCWIDSEKDYYRFIAYDVHELITPDDEGFWD